MKNRIREWREVRGWTLDALASAADTSPQQISRLELSERGLNDKWLARLSAALGTSKADLLCDVRVAPRHREFTQDAEEVRLLLAWRSLTVEDRAAFLRMLSRLASPFGDIRQAS